jgi:hypothetical protein
MRPVIWRRTYLTFYVWLEPGSLTLGGRNAASAAGEGTGRLRTEMTMTIPSGTTLADASQPRCLWCGRHYQPVSRRGSPRRFCSEEHRHEYSSQARAWGTAAHEMGLLTVEDLKAGKRSVRAFLERLAIGRK